MMIKKFVMFLLILVHTYSVPALPIYSFDRIDEFGSKLIFNQIQYSVYFGWNLIDPPTDFPIGPAPGGMVFDLILSNNDVGNTYTVSSGTEFDEASMNLTNGINDTIFFAISDYPKGGFSGNGGNEAALFFGDNTGGNGIDLAGYSINSISLLINNLNFDTPGDNPNGDGVWTDVNFNVTLAVDVNESFSVPEPATTVLICTGLVGLIAYRVKRKEEEVF